VLLLHLIALSETRPRAQAYTHTHIYTHSLTSLDEGSAYKRDLYLTTQTLVTNIRAPGGIRSLIPSKRATADPYLWPCGHRDRSHFQVNAL